MDSSRRSDDGLQEMNDEPGEIMARNPEIEGNRPLARSQALVTAEAGDELLVYDLTKHRAHCLNRGAAFVWSACDGRRTIDEIAEQASAEMQSEVDGEWVTLALKQLDDARLLAGRYGYKARISRRELVRRLGWGAAVAIPLVSTILAPTPVAAGSCLASGATCGVSVQCCSGVCTGSVCA
jgi:hypothetical protein